MKRKDQRSRTTLGIRLPLAFPWLFVRITLWVLRRPERAKSSIHSEVVGWGGLAGEEKMKSSLSGLLAKGLMGLEVVAQEGDSPRSVMATPGIEPPGGGPDLAVLLRGSLLRNNELRGKGDHPGLAGSHQGGGDRDMTMLNPSIRMIRDMTGGTMDRISRNSKFDFS